MINHSPWLLLTWLIFLSIDSTNCFIMKSSDDRSDEFPGVAWKLSGIQHSGWGWEVHSTSQERWMKMFWKVIFVPLCDGTTDLWLLEGM